MLVSVSKSPGESLKCLNPKDSQFTVLQGERN